MGIAMKFRAALLAASVALASLPALAQTVVQVPQNVPASTVVDLGNGPTEIRMLQGNMGVFTSQGSGVGSTSGSSTTLTLTASAAANPPCVGCIISGTGITSGTTVAAFNGTTGITLSAAMTVAASTALAWGQACPSGQPTNPLALIQAAVGSDLPMYTQARVCAYGVKGPGALYTTFAIGAH
jgi:hypothetical protein